MSAAKFERITAADVEVGDWIARTRTATFKEVREIREGDVSRRFYFSGHRHDNIRPRRTAKLWREARA